VSRLDHLRDGPPGPGPHRLIRDTVPRSRYRVRPNSVLHASWPWPSSAPTGSTRNPGDSRGPAQAIAVRGLCTRAYRAAGVPPARHAPVRWWWVPAGPARSSGSTRYLPFSPSEPGAAADVPRRGRRRVVDGDGQLLRPSCVGSAGSMRRPSGRRRTARCPVTAKPDYCPRGRPGLSPRVLSAPAGTLAP